MGVREYEIDGKTFLLNERDAKLLGAKLVRRKRATAAANKSRQVANKSTSKG
jgi:hypothetical protein